MITGDKGPFTSRVRGLYRPPPVTRSRGTRSHRLIAAGSVSAAAGVYLSAPGIENALPGGLLKSVRSPEERAASTTELGKESQPVPDLAESGVALTADTLGGLEALATESKEAGVPIHVAEVGPVHRALTVRMATVRNPTHRAILAFNVPVLPDAAVEATRGAVRIFAGDVMYQLLEQYALWRDETQRALEAEQRQETVHPAKFEVLGGFVFRRSKPAIVGIRVLAGRLRPGVRLMLPDGSEAGVLKSLQNEGEPVREAAEGAEIAASIEGAVVGRTFDEGAILYVSLPESSARALRDRPLTDSEKRVYEDVLRIRRATSPFWGQ